MADKLPLPEVSRVLSKVANSPGKSIIFAIFMLAGITGVSLFLIFGSSDSSEGAKFAQTKLTKPPVVVIPPKDDTNTIALPKLPAIPTLKEPELPPPAIPKQEVKAPPKTLPDMRPEKLPQLTAPDIKQASAQASQAKAISIDARRKSNMMLINNQHPAKSAVVEVNKVEDIVVTKSRGDIGYILPQGRIIEAILETALDTSVGGRAQAVVTQDVYAEQGHAVLIPRGSIIFGAYKNSIEGNYSRINVTWDKINLPNGTTLAFSGISVDNLGRQGIIGRYDGKYKEQLANAALSSALNIGVAAVLDDFVAPQISANQLAKDTAAVNNIRTLTLATYSNTTYTTDQKIANICSITRDQITNKTSTAYKTVDQTCNSLMAATSGDANQRLLSLMNTVNATVDQLARANTDAATVTRVETAANQAFNNIGNTAQNMVNQTKFTPTITVDSGQKVRIYVSKDYRFPRNTSDQMIIIE